MNNKIKKHLAKEFLIIIISGLLVLITYITFITVEKNKINTIISIENEIEVVERAGIRVLIKDFYAKYDPESYSDEQVNLILRKYGKDYQPLIKYFYNKYDPERYSLEKMEEIVDFYSLDNEAFYNLCFDEKQNYINELQKKLETIQDNDYSYFKQIIFFILILAYPIRIIYLGLIWSFKVLKNN